MLPSIAEPFGLVLIEAMSLGRPVVATRAGGPSEIVEDGLTGLLVAPAEPPALAEAIIRLLQDESLRLAMGRRGFERFTEKYTLERMTGAILETYRMALGMPNPAGAEAPTLVANGSNSYVEKS